MLLIFFRVFEFSTTDFDLEVLRGVETVAAVALAASSITIAMTRTTWVAKKPFVFDMNVLGPVNARVSQRGYAKAPTARRVQNSGWNYRDSM
ncbi:MAG: hypothetical protein ACHP79_17105, partial [Terriglobales bacterium]